MCAQRWPETPLISFRDDMRGLEELTVYVWIIIHFNNQYKEKRQTLISVLNWCEQKCTLILYRANSSIIFVGFGGGGFATRPRDAPPPRSCSALCISCADCHVYLPTNTRPTQAQCRPNATPRWADIEPAVSSWNDHPLFFRWAEG